MPASSVPGPSIAAFTLQYDQYLLRVLQKYGELFRHRNKTPVDGILLALWCSC